MIVARRCGRRPSTKSCCCVPARPGSGRRRRRRSRVAVGPRPRPRPARRRPSIGNTHASTLQARRGEAVPRRAAAGRRRHAYRCGAGSGLVVHDAGGCLTGCPRGGVGSSRRAGPVVCSSGLPRGVRQSFVERALGRLPPWSRSTHCSHCSVGRQVVGRWCIVLRRAGVKECWHEDRHRRCLHVRARPAGVASTHRLPLRRGSVPRQRAAETRCWLVDS